jgi:hypothetical protein
MKDKLDFDKMSTQVEYNPGLHAPIIKGSLSVRDLYDEDSEDSVLVFDGDSIYLYLTMDSIFTFDMRDFIEIQDQDPQNYTIESPDFDLIFPFSQLYTIDNSETFKFSFENNMRIDSLLVNTGVISIEVSSNFSTNGALRVTCPSLYMNNSVFETIIPFSRPSGDYHGIHNIPIENGKIVFDNSDPDSSMISIDFQVFMAVNAGDTIKANSYANINFSIHDIDNFESAFGYLGDYTFNHDTIIETELDEIEGLSGTFAITNPKINLEYTHTFGLPIGFDVDIKGYFDDGDSVVLQPGQQDILASPDYQNPEVNGKLSFSRSNISNIDQLLVFPPPVEIGYNATIMSNPDGDTSANNFVLGNSELLIGMEVEIPLEFRADLQIRDTLKFEIDDSEEAEYIEYANLHYRFRNEFPLDIDAILILYDSINLVNIDTIKLNEQSGYLFLNAAPVDADGLTILEQVLEIPGVVSLGQDEINAIFNEANKVIIVGSFRSYDPENVSSVKLLDSYKLDFKFNLETKLYYKGSLD